MSTIGVGIVGFGLGGKTFHAPFISNNPNFTLKQVLTQSKDNIAYAKKHYPMVDVVSSFEQMLNNQEIDLIVLALPNKLHYEYCTKALLANKHVVVEKPFTITPSDANELIALAVKQHKILSVFHNRRWDSDFQTVKKVLASKTLGKIVAYEAHFDRFRNYVKEGAWKELDEPGTGILYDLGSHLIDQTLHLFGKPNSIFADLRMQREHSAVVDDFEILLFYDSLKVTLKSSMLVKGPEPKFRIYGQNGTFLKYGMDIQEPTLVSGNLDVSDENWGYEPTENNGTLYYLKDGKDVTLTVSTEQGHYGHYYENIAKAIQHNEILAVKPEEAKEVIYIIEKAIESNEQQKVLPLSF